MKLEISGIRQNLIIRRKSPQARTLLLYSVVTAGATQTCGTKQVGPGLAIQMGNSILEPLVGSGLQLSSVGSAV